MPGHRKRRQFKQTDAFTRGMVIGLKRAGWSIRQIAADTHLGASTVHRLWRRWLEQGNVAIYRNVGATRVTSARVDRRILRQAVAAPQATCTAILQHVQDTLDHSISTRTISRRLVANGLHSCRPLRRLPLTPPNRRQRLEWCRARSTWMTEWHRVVFSDESRFCLSSDSRRVRVWRRRGERSNTAAIVERPTVRQRGIMVWGAIAYDSRSPLLRIQGTMTAQRYVDDVLRPVTLPYLQGVPNALYQQDNARPHTARISQQALQDVQMLPWPPYSPDLSPIEHVWDIIGRRLHALPQPRSEDELWQMAEALGLVKALENATTLPNHLTLGFFLDNLSVVKSVLNSKTGNYLIDKALLLISRLNRNGNRCTIQWIKGHSGNVGREDVNDEERAGRPSTSTTDEKINKVEKMILANRRITVREVAEDLNISIGSCHSIFINDLGMRRVAAKFVPKLLNCDQKQHRMNIANEMLDSVRDGPNLLQRVITGDEAWVYGYDVETKAQSSQWKLPHEPRPKKARQVRSNVKVFLTVFFDCRGVVHHEFLPQGRTVNKEYYLQVMRNLREAIRQKRPDLWKNKNWLLHHDNAPAHTSLLVREFLAKTNTLMMPQPPYSPDLSPCDFFLFPKLKRPMKGRRYATLDEIKTASKAELKKILKNDFLKCFENWKNRWHKCIISHGDYFEGDKIGIHE
ncbi:hypothetical protein LAZ67_7002057 [Cordylochernes scorpioides]|uniref:Transposase n=1 Tax=Cordylochernes scorpioides TaxID=51811 RepID=A0ABY6KR04_9ARAC|nr:hypothetical protein LAZ67_7002057 [Cordylochernes scorpioides]